MLRIIFAILLLALPLLSTACRANSTGQRLDDLEARQYNDREMTLSRLGTMEGRIETLEREMGDIRQAAGLLPPGTGKSIQAAPARRASAGKTPPPAMAAAPLPEPTPQPPGDQAHIRPVTATAKPLPEPTPQPSSDSSDSPAAPVANGHAQAVEAPAISDTPPPPPAKKAAEARPRSAKSAYDSALAMYYKAQYGKAEEAFSSFLKDYPKSPLAPNALYWKGECLYSRDKFDRAILAFKDVASKYPKHDKAAAALLKAGYAYAKLKDMENARFYWQLLIDDYPASAPARLARQRMGNN